MEGEEILRVENLVRRFGGFKALNGVSLSISGRGVTSIIGPNGAGKTTLINVITGRLKPDAGRVYFMGRDITGWPPHKIVRIGIARTFQIINLFTGLSVYHNIAIASLSRGNSADVDGIIRRFGLDEYRDHEVIKLPHGIQRIVEIAVAMATKPRLLILDEPMAGLNSGEKGLVIERIRDMEKQIPVILVEHDMDVVFSISRRIIVMNRGEVIASGAPDEIADNRLVREIYLGE